MCKKSCQEHFILQRANQIVLEVEGAELIYVSHFEYVFDCGRDLDAA